MKKAARWISAFVLTPVVVFLLLTALLYYPPFQAWAVRQASEYASEQTGMHVSVGQVRLKFPLDLSLGDVLVVKQGEQSADTLAHIQTAVVDVQLLPLFRKKVIVDELSLEHARINTADIIAAAQVSGDIGKLRLTDASILLKGREAPTLSEALLPDILLTDARLNITIPDSVPEDTTEDVISWKILVGQAKVKNSDIRIIIPDSTTQQFNNSTTQPHLSLSLLTINDGSFDLKNGIYTVSSLALNNSTACYQDYHLKDVALKADSISYQSPTPPSSDNYRLSARLCSLSFKEDYSTAGSTAHGLNVENISGHIAIADNRLSLRKAEMKTSESSITADLDIPLDIFSSPNSSTIQQFNNSTVQQFNSSLKASLHASIGKQDLMRFMGNMPAGFRQKWPNDQLSVDGTVRGDKQHISFTELKMSLPTAFSAKASGSVDHLDQPDLLKADIDLQAQAKDIAFVKELLPNDLRKDINLPQGITLNGNLKANGQRYDTRFTFGQGGGSLNGTAHYDKRKETYKADLQARQLPLQRFLPSYGLSPLTANISLNGQGTDLLSKRSRLTAKAQISQFNYAGYDLADIQGTVQLGNGYLKGDIISANHLLKGTAHASARLGKNHLSGTLMTDLSHADLQRLGLSDSMLTVSGCGVFDFDSNLKDRYCLQGNIDDLTVRMTDSSTGKPVTYRPGSLSIDALTSPEKTHAIAYNGDFRLNIEAKGNYEKLIGTGTRLLDEMKSQYANRMINQERLRRVLPQATLSIKSGRDNFFVELLNRYGYSLRQFTANLTSSPVDGLNGRLHAESLFIDSILIDTLNFAIQSDSVRTVYQAQVRNNKKNAQYTFNALIDGILKDRGTILGARLYDANDELGLRLGLQATMEDDGFMFRTYGKEAILGYRTFHANDDNYVFLGPENRISANVMLKADDGTGLQLYTPTSPTTQQLNNSTIQQDITLSLHHFNLERILSVVPYTPDITGMLSGDLHLTQEDGQISVSTHLDVHQMTYEKSPMGDIGTEFVYMPLQDGSHYVDGIFIRDGEEMATLSGTYYSESNGRLEATAELTRMPLSMLNGFIPDQLIGFEGYAEGSLAIHGPLAQPVVNGEVYLDSAYMVSQPYGIRLRFDNDPVAIKNSKLLLENFNMYANNSSPLTSYGTLDFSNLDHIRLDMKMRAQNFLLIDAKENPRSEAYGKAYVNFFGNITGEVSNLKMRGKLDVLGTTDLVYILRDSPLTTDNQLDELVRFTDFNDTTLTTVTRPDFYGFNMDMTIDVSKGAHVMAYLNTDKTNYIDLMGGGTLRMLYSQTDDLRLTGRYTLANGEMKYSLPVIPLKTFTIKDGSYIEFTGDPMNPTLNIIATEKMKTAVTAANGVGRSVEFDCGVNITKTLNDMGLEFTLDAPEDMQLHSELQAMSKEQRGKLAVTMLTTGMYLADGNTNGFSMNNALNTFLQSEINNITGNALRTLDFSIGLDNTTNATGSTTTNYSFQFAKRFWNNRLKIAVGGKVTTGAEAYEQNNSFFDNVTFEYRLDDTANKYVTLFYENNVYDWLDGYTQEYGVGFIWRRSLQHFKDIFNLRDKQQTLSRPAERRDTLGTDSLTK